MTESKQPPPQPLQTPTQRASLLGLGSWWSHGSPRPRLHPLDRAVRSWLQGSPAPRRGRASTPGAARATREDGGRRATAPPALATGQAQRHLSVLQPADPTPRSRFRVDSGRGTLRSPLGRKKEKKKYRDKKKYHQNTKSSPRHSPPSPGPPADTGLAGGLRTAEPSQAERAAAWAASSAGPRGRQTTATAGRA